MRPRVSLSYDGGGSINMGSAPAGSCHSVAMTGRIIGAEVLFDGTSFWWIKFLSACEYTDDPAGSVPTDTAIDLLISSSQTFAN